MNKELLKRYAISTGITFLAGFAIALLADIDTITLDTFKDGTIYGIVFAAVRAGLKAILEGFVAWRANK